MSRASSTKDCKCLAELSATFTFFSNLVTTAQGPIVYRISSIIWRIGRIEFSGVLNSCATDEKKVALSFWPYFSISLSLVMSVQITITWWPSLIFEVLTWRNLRLGCAISKTSSFVYSSALSCFTMYDHKFMLLCKSGCTICWPPYFWSSLLSLISSFVLYLASWSINCWYCTDSYSVENRSYAKPTILHISLLL